MAHKSSDVLVAWKQRLDSLTDFDVDVDSGAVAVSFAVRFRMSDSVSI